MIQKRNFPNLNGIRCIAAFLVIFHHLEQAKEAFGIRNIYEISIIKHAGRLGVGLFFVLSGFLITYLLLQEKGNFGDISARKFYLRRVFRIWPIYFLLIFLSCFIFPKLSLFYFPGASETLHYYYTNRLFLLSIVLPNYAFVLYGLPYWCAQTWSIGVEEQFYYLWPWIIKYPKKTIYIVFIFGFITIFLLWFGLHDLIATDIQKYDSILTFIGQFRLLIMALGGGGAYLVYSNNKTILPFLFQKNVQIVVYIVFLILFFSGFHFPGFMEVYAFFFLFFILNLAANAGSIISLENPFMNYMGKISYGLYLYHVFVTVFVINILNAYLGLISSSAYNGILYISIFVFSIAISALSYEYLEKPILAFKDKRYGR
ncbi:MAG: acyltransferase [Siphonobacter sp.]